MKVRFFGVLLGLLFYASNVQAATFSCVQEGGTGEFLLENFSGSQQTKIYKSYWADQLANMYVLTDSRNDNSKLIETYSLAYTIYSSESSKTFRLTYKNHDPKAKKFEVVHWGKTYHCE